MCLEKWKTHPSCTTSNIHFIFNNECYIFDCQVVRLGAVACSMWFCAWFLRREGNMLSCHEGFSQVRGGRRLLGLFYCLIVHSRTWHFTLLPVNGWEEISTLKTLLMSWVRHNDNRVGLGELCRFNYLFLWDDWFVCMLWVYWCLGIIYCVPHPHPPPLTN